MKNSVCPSQIKKNEKNRIDLCSSNRYMYFTPTAEIDDDVSGDEMAAVTYCRVVLHRQLTCLCHLQ